MKRTGLRCLKVGIRAGKSVEKEKIEEVENIE
jgi:hypothetical protein